MTNRKNSVELRELCGEKPNAARSVPTPLYINSQFLILNSKFKNGKRKQTTLE
jgi:hypothetical protein